MPALNITNIKSLNPIFVISTIIYIKFSLLKNCLYIQNNAGSFHNTNIYLSIFGIIVAKSINIKIIKIFFFK